MLRNPIKSLSTGERCSPTSSGISERPPPCCVLPTEVSAWCPFHYKAGQQGAAPVRTGVWSGHTAFLQRRRILSVHRSLRAAATDFDAVFISLRKSKKWNHRLRVHICQREVGTKWHKGEVWTRISEAWIFVPDLQAWHLIWHLITNP